MTPATAAFVRAVPGCAPIPEVFTSHWRDNRKRLAALCAVCPMLDACRELVLTTDVEGFAAGMTPLQRVRARKLREQPEQEQVA